MSNPADRPAARTSFPAAHVPSLLIGAARFIATGSATDERFGLFRWDIPATSGGATPHVHRMSSS